MHALLNVAVMAARRAGETLIRKMVSLEKLKVEEKGHNDFVSDADRAAEQAVISTVQKHYPDHAFLAEESGVTGESDHVWIVDPLDGTTNFLHGFPVFAVSIGVQVRGRHGARLRLRSRAPGTVHGYAWRRRQLDGHRLRVSGQKLLSRALVGTGFPFRQADLRHRTLHGDVRQVLGNTSGVRRAGAAALDLATSPLAGSTASSRPGSRPGTWPPGTLMIREAGGIIAGLDGGEASSNRSRPLRHAEIYAETLRHLHAGNQGALATQAESRPWGDALRQVVDRASGSLTGSIEVLRLTSSQQGSGARDIDGSIGRRPGSRRSARSRSADDLAAECQ